jgi:hypothetical protein
MLQGLLGLLVLGAVVTHAQDSTGNLLTGNARATVLTQYKGAALPKPVIVQLNDFTLDGNLVPDDSMAARLHQHSLLNRSNASPDDPQATVASLRASFTKAFISNLRKKQVNAAHVDPTTDKAISPRLVVSGQFLAVDEGDRTKRVMLGFGRGGSDLKAHVTATLVDASLPSPLVVFECNIDAKSGKQPGALATMEVGSLAMGAATHSVGDSGASVQKDAARMGKLVAAEIEQAMVAQHWLEPAAK